MSILQIIQLALQLIRVLTPLIAKIDRYGEESVVFEKLPERARALIVRLAAVASQN